MSTPRFLLAFTLCSFALASAAQSDWSIVDSPNSRPTKTSNFPFGVTCVSAADCWAVGYYNNTGSIVQTLIEHWDGISWSVVASPDTSVIQNNLLRSVACATASDCWAVGTWYEPAGTPQTLIEHWDGTAWSIVPSPNTSATQGNSLTAVACVSTSECWAAGSYFNGTAYQSLTERWNGTSWSIVTSPNTSVAQENTLTGVTCVSASQCWAAGFSVNATTGLYQTLIQRWDGSSWAIVAAPNTLIPQDNRLWGVTCASASDCWAVGSFDNRSVEQTLVVHWDGMSWTLVTSPNSMITQENKLLSVTCASPSNCWAAGTWNNGTVQQTLIQRWDGSSWTTVTSPNNATDDNTLWGVACASGAACWATGTYSAGTVAQTLMERWDGSSWAIVPSPDTSAVQNNTLLGVTCASSSDCWTVASYYNGSVQQTLIEHWDGAAWTIVSSPNTDAAQSNILYDVTCVSATECWAVGYYLAAGGWQTLILRWDGTSWSIVSSPSTAPAENNFLTDVACVSATDCWAVGYYDTGVAYQTLVEHWDGTSWAIVSSPNTGASQENRLNGVTCTSTADCWAVGRYFDGILLRTLIERWDGNSWTIVTSPNTETPQNNVLSSVACATTSECWAVGNSDPGSGNGLTLIERWDGTSWDIVTSPNPPAEFKYNFLKSVTCTAASDCWAVGYHFIEGAYRTLIERWDGSSWTIVASPNTSATQYNFLIGVTCVTASDCWATGYHYDESGIIQTLTEHYTASLPPTARLTANPTSGAAPLHVAFDASTSSDPDPTASIASFTIGFGDGSLAETQSSPFFNHTYTQSGLFTAELFVTNSRGVQSLNTAEVSIAVSSVTAPAIHTVDVISSCEDTSSITITVNGTNFVSGSVVQVNGSNRLPASATVTQLRLTLFASDLTSSRVALRVVNPDGGVSPIATLFIALPADLNLEGSVDAPDLVIAANYLVGNVTPGTAPFSAPLSAADLNHDGSVNVVDIVVLANYLAGNISCLSP